MRANAITYADLIVTGIGTLETALTSQYPWLGYMNSQMLDELRSKGAVGSICARFFNRSGMEIDCTWNNCCMGISLEHLHRRDEVICVTSGEEKAAAILGAVRGKFVSTLISDSRTASLVLERDR